MEDTFSLEKNIAQIKNIVEKMQKGVVNFDEHIALFKEGIQLIKESQQYLNEAEGRIQQLISDEWVDFDQDITND